jgi:hypothetical protein
MEGEIKTERKKKSDKSKQNFERNGGFTQRHVRIAEALAEKRAKSKSK